MIKHTGCKMNKIKFEKAYPKLHNQTMAELIYVKHFPSNLEMHIDFIEYDTVNVHGEHYKLPTGEFLYLVFLGNKMIPFSTIREFTSEKEDFYKAHIGKRFNIRIEEGRREYLRMAKEGEDDDDDDEEGSE
jgi:hypothetical protein